ncbi:Sodium- and chloride-dependent GABA transporter ine [Diplonema papillatum]|nr:Sodium- and chloride-dependent GABA transporter ine [Diplonema papillatum]
MYGLHYPIQPAKGLLSRGYESDSEEEEHSLDAGLTLFGGTTTLASFCLGLGNAFHFPYLVAKHGGAMFVIVYAICLVCAGLPLFYLEVWFGQATRKSTWHCYRSIHPRFEGIGWASSVSLLTMQGYYSVLCGYCLLYFFYSFESPLPWSADLNRTGVSYDAEEAAPRMVAMEFFLDSILDEDTSNSNGLGGLNWKLVVASACIFAAVHVKISRGVKNKDVVKYVLLGTPLLVTVILAMIFAFLDGAEDGLHFYLRRTQWGDFFEGHLWADAFFLALFSMSPGTGAVITHASYIAKRVKTSHVVLCVAFLDFTLSLASGVVVFALIGHVAHIRNVPVAAPSGAPAAPMKSQQDYITDLMNGTGGDLAIVVVAESLSFINGGHENLAAAAYFFATFLLGFTTLVAWTETLTTQVNDALARTRMKVGNATASFVVCLASFLVSLPFSTRKGDMLRATSNHYVDYAIVSTCILELFMQLFAPVLVLPPKRVRVFTAIVCPAACVAGMAWRAYNDFKGWYTEEGDEQYPPFVYAYPLFWLGAALGFGVLGVVRNWATVPDKLGLPDHNDATAPPQYLSSAKKNRATLGSAVRAFRDDAFFDDSDEGDLADDLVETARTAPLVEDPPADTPSDPSLAAGQFVAASSASTLGCRQSSPGDSGGRSGVPPPKRRVKKQAPPPPGHADGGGCDDSAANEGGRPLPLPGSSDGAGSTAGWGNLHQPALVLAGALSEEKGSGTGARPDDEGGRLREISPTTASSGAPRSAASFSFESMERPAGNGVEEGLPASLAEGYRSGKEPKSADPTGAAHANHRPASSNAPPQPEGTGKRAAKSCASSPASHASPREASGASFSFKYPPKAAAEASGERRKSNTSSTGSPASPKDASAASFSFRSPPAGRAKGAVRTSNGVDKPAKSSPSTVGSLKEASVASFSFKNPLTAQAKEMVQSAHPQQPGDDESPSQAVKEFQFPSGKFPRGALYYGHRLDSPGSSPVSVTVNGSAPALRARHLSSGILSRTAPKASFKPVVDGEAPFKPALTGRSTCGFLNLTASSPDSLGFQKSDSIGSLPRAPSWKDSKKPPVLRPEL